MSCDTIPGSPNDFDAAWLTNTLRSGGHLPPNRTIKELRTEALSNALATFGSLYRLHIESDAAEVDLPRTMIAKLPSDNPGSVALMQRNGGYRNEVSFYQNMASDAGFRTPRCFGASINEAADRFVLLLEDLSSFRQPGQLSREECEAVTLAMAQSHAKWWQSERLNSLPWLQDIRNDSRRLYDGFQRGWPIVVDRLGSGLVNPEVLGSRIAESFWNNRAFVEDPPVTFVHLDVIAQNLFFESREDRLQPIFIDFQNLRRGRAAASLAAFLAFVPERSKIEHRLVEQYHEMLVSSGVRGYSREQCFRDYWCGLLRRFSSVTGAIAAVGPDSKQAQFPLEAAGRFGLATLREYVDRLG